MQITPLSSGNDRLCLAGPVDPGTQYKSQRIFHPVGRTAPPRDDIGHSVAAPIDLRHAQSGRVRTEGNSGGPPDDCSDDSAAVVEKPPAQDFALQHRHLYPRLRAVTRGRDQPRQPLQPRSRIRRRQTRSSSTDVGLGDHLQRSSEKGSSGRGHGSGGKHRKRADGLSPLGHRPRPAHGRLGGDNVSAPQNRRMTVQRGNRGGKVIEQFWNPADVDQWGQWERIGHALYNSCRQATAHAPDASWHSALHLRSVSQK